MNRYTAHKKRKGKRKRLKSMKGGLKSMKGGLKSMKGGFIPSVMEGFTVAASQYIVPLAFFAGYKLWNRSKKRQR